MLFSIKFQKLTEIGGEKYFRKRYPFLKVMNNGSDD
jgi:hypothetical protein